MTTRNTCSVCLLPLTLAAAISIPAAAQQAGNQAPAEILVMGSDFSLRGNPVTATEGLVYQQQLALRPISRTAELLEFVPGMIATQHSGEGKANQYFVRGFNLDHGTDFAIRVDRMPVNMPSHGHGQGYADINFVIPELISTLRYRKGSYYADGGDFATAGQADFVYTNALDEGQVNLTLGEHDYRRIFAGQSLSALGGTITAAAAVSQYHGPWELDQDLNKRKGFLKYHQGDEHYSFSITGMSYLNEWTATDQIPQRAVDSGLITRWGNIDPTAGGDSRRHSLSMDWQETLSAQSNWHFSAYIMDYALDLYSNFTYFDADPLRGDQFQQTDSRRIAGLDTAYVRELNSTPVPTTITTGVQHRYDNIHVGLHQSEQRVRYASTRDDRIAQSLSSVYVSADQQWSESLRTVTAVRADHYRFDVDDLLGNNGGRRNDSQVSPKLNVIYTPMAGVETFASAGIGFHSNDARGATAAVDPVDPLAKARSYEVGVRTALVPKTQISLTAFSMRLSSELVYVGDEGTTEAVDASQREGAELSFLYTPLSWLLIDGDVTVTHARLRGAAPDNYIPNAVKNTASLGVILDDIRGTGWSGGLRLRYLGAAPLIEDNSARSNSTFLANAQVSKNLGTNVTVSLELLNLFDSKDRDITYFYESRLPGEAEAVEDIHFHPVEPRSLRASITARF